MKNQNLTINDKDLKVTVIDYNAFQTEAFKNALRTKGYGQCGHSVPGTPDKWIVELKEPIIHNECSFNALVFVDPENAIYLEEDYETALDNAETNEW